LKKSEKNIVAQFLKFAELRVQVDRSGPTDVPLSTAAPFAQQVNGSRIPLRDCAASGSEPDGVSPICTTMSLNRLDIDGCSAAPLAQRSHRHEICAKPTTRREALVACDRGGHFVSILRTAFRGREKNGTRNQADCRDLCPAQESQGDRGPADP